MRAAPYGIDCEDDANYKDGGRCMNPQRYHGFPSATPILQSANSDSDRAFDRSSLDRLKNSYLLNENGNLSQGRSPILEWRRMNGEMEVRMRDTRWSGEGAGYSKSNYQEGPSKNFHGSSDSRLGESPSHHNEYDAPKAFEYLERDRADILRKLSELDDQLLRSGSVGEQLKQRHHVERSRYHHESFGDSADWLQYNSPVSSSGSRVTDKRFTNFSSYHEGHPYKERRNLTTHDSYLSSGSSNAIKRHEEYVASQIPVSGTPSTPGQYQEYSPYSSHVLQKSANKVVPQMCGSPHYYNPQHQPDCSCFQCYNSNLNSPQQVQSRSPLNTRRINSPSNPKHYHQKDAQVGFNSDNSHSPLDIGSQINHVRWPSALDPPLDEVARLYPKSTTSVKVKHSFHPIAGGAPFVTCSNCFEMLQIRREIMKLHNQEQKIKCGGCSSLTHFSVEGKKLVISKEMRHGSNIDEDKEKREVEEMLLHTRGRSQTSKSFHSDEFCCSVNDEGINETDQVEHTSNVTPVNTKENSNNPEDSSIEAVDYTLSDHCLEIRDTKTLHSGNLNWAGCETPLMDNTPVLSVPTYASLSNKSLDALSLLSAVDSEDDIPQEELANLDNASDELIYPSSTISAPLERNCDALSLKHSQVIIVQNEENGSERFSPRANVVSDEVSKLETTKAKSSVDTIGGSTLEDCPKVNNEVFVPQSHKDGLVGSAQPVRNAEAEYDVRINEHLIPDHLVRKAEDLAGPILPGNYWYDFRAGFWGVTGGPCCGILPPKIQQFDYPMTKDCAGGTTGVVVNGRELHRKDLALLHSRGLPIERGRSYILELSGRVLDEKSGEELYCLGPLAPTVLRLKRGFGMRVTVCRQ